MHVKTSFVTLITRRPRGLILLLQIIAMCSTSVLLEEREREREPASTTRWVGNPRTTCAATCIYSTWIYRILGLYAFYNIPLFNMHTNVEEYRVNVSTYGVHVCCIRNTHGYTGIDMYGDIFRECQVNIGLEKSETKFSVTFPLSAAVGP